LFKHLNRLLHLLNLLSKSLNLQRVQLLPLLVRRQLQVNLQLHLHQTQVQCHRAQWVRALATIHLELQVLAWVAPREPATIHSELQVLEWVVQIAPHVKVELAMECLPVQVKVNDQAVQVLVVQAKARAQAARVKANVQAVQVLVAQAAVRAQEDSHQLERRQAAHLVKVLLAVAVTQPVLLVAVENQAVQKPRNQSALSVRNSTI
jgi:hypothetical protein